MRALVVACLLLSANAAMAQGKKQPEQNPPYVGRWYTGDVKECKHERRSPLGPLEFTAKELYGVESRCRIVGSQPKGNAIELLLRCRGEGETWTDRETVSVSGNKLHRQLTVEGKRITATHTRCP